MLAKGMTQKRDRESLWADRKQTNTSLIPIAIIKIPGKSSGVQITRDCVAVLDGPDGLQGLLTKSAREIRRQDVRREMLKALISDVIKACERLF